MPFLACLKNVQLGRQGGKQRWSGTGRQPAQGRTSPGTLQRAPEAALGWFHVCSTRLIHSGGAVAATADLDSGAGLKVALEMTLELLHSEVDAGNYSRHGFRGGSRNGSRFNSRQTLGFSGREGLKMAQG